MITENLTPEQRLQILRELAENPSPEELDLINNFHKKIDGVAVARQIAEKRNDYTKGSAGVLGKKLI